MCNQVETVFKAIGYIESHLNSQVNVSQIADSVGYSLFHFIRVFNRTVHCTPYDYLMRRRLSEAARILVTSDRRIIDISHDFCFNNQESFSRAFKRMFHSQPNQWRLNNRESSMVIKPPVTLAGLQFINQDTFEYPAPEKMPEMTLYGLMTALYGDSQAQAGQRKRIFSDLCNSSAIDVHSRLVAVTSYTESNRHCAYYFLGIVEKESLSAFPVPVIHVIPGGNFIRINSRMDDNKLALDYVYHTWFPRARLIPAGNMEIEFLPLEEETWSLKSIYIPIKEKRDRATASAEQ